MTLLCQKEIIQVVRILQVTISPKLSKETPKEQYTQDKSSPSILNGQSLQVHRDCHMLQRLAVQLLLYSCSQVLGQLPGTASIKMGSQENI